MTETTEQDLLDIQSIPKDSLVTLKQIHGSHCVKVLKNQEAKVRGTEGDGLITSDYEVVLGVRTADCFPVLILDDEKKVISCIHAGWRGLSKKILDHCVEIMIKDFSCHPESMVTAIGPGIGKCCYRVKEDVIEELENRRVPFRSFLFPAEDGSFNLDLKGILMEQLIEKKISRDRIHHAPYCTSCSSLPLPSYRREGEEAGRALSFIMLSKKDRRCL